MNEISKKPQETQLETRWKTHIQEGIHLLPSSLGLPADIMGSFGYAEFLAPRLYLEMLYLDLTMRSRSLMHSIIVKENLNYMLQYRNK